MWIPRPAPSLALAAAWSPECHWCSTRVPRGRLASLRVCWALVAGCCLAAASFCRMPSSPRLLALVGHLLPFAPHLLTCTSWHDLRALCQSFVSVSELPALQHVIERTPVQCHICLTPVGLMPRATVVGWGLSSSTSRRSSSPLQPGAQVFQFWAAILARPLEHFGLRMVSLVVCRHMPVHRRWDPAPYSRTSRCGPLRTAQML